MVWSVQVSKSDRPRIGRTLSVRRIVRAHALWSCSTSIGRRPYVVSTNNSPWTCPLKLFKLEKILAFPASQNPRPQLYVLWKIKLFVNAWSIVWSHDRSQWCLIWAFPYQSQLAFSKLTQVQRRASRAKRKCPGNAARAMHMEQQSFREFISGLKLSDRDSRSEKAERSLPEARSAEVQRGARMPGQRRAGKLVKYKIRKVLKRLFPVCKIIKLFCCWCFDFFLLLFCSPACLSMCKTESHC